MGLHEFKPNLRARKMAETATQTPRMKPEKSADRMSLRTVLTSTCCKLDCERGGRGKQRFAMHGVR